MPDARRPTPDDRRRLLMPDARTEADLTTVLFECEFFEPFYFDLLETIFELYFKACLPLVALILDHLV